jgi:uncharacterized protein (DUF58 family)
MPRPTGRGYTLLALAAGTYLAGRVVGTWELYLIAIAFLAAVVVSWILVAATGRQIRVTRTLTPERPVDGDTPEFTYRVKNASRLPGPQLTLRSPLGDLSPLDPALEVPSLAPRGETVLKTHIGWVNRGVHSLPAVQAVADDPLGMVSSAHKVSAPLVVTVLPRIAFLDSCALYPDIGLKHDWSGQHGLHAIGASEFRGIRPHQPGEPLSHIDWKSTAKTGILMLREMEDPAGADITILLDGTAAQLVGEAPGSNFELAVRAAGSIGDFVLRTGHGVTLVTHERNHREVRLTADGAGRRALLQALAEVRPDGTAPLVNALRRLRTDGAHLVRIQSVTVVSLSLDEPLVRALLRLKEDGARLAFVHLAGPSFAGKAEGDGSSLLPFLPPQEEAGSSARAARAGDTLPPDGAAPGAATGERTDSLSLSPEARALLLSISSAGIPCVTLSRGDSLQQRLSLWSAERPTRAAAR